MHPLASSSHAAAALAVPVDPPVRSLRRAAAARSRSTSSSRRFSLSRSTSSRRIRMPSTSTARNPTARAGRDDAPSAAIVPDRARYHVFEMDGVDFLIGSGDDGRLDVRDAFVCDRDPESPSASPSYSRPDGHDAPDLPQRPLPFVAIPWETRFDGDTLYKKPAWSKLQRVYLVAARATEPSLRLDLETVVRLDASTRSLRREEVDNRATTDDPDATTLRIRADRILLVDSDTLPSPDEIIDGHDTSFPVDDKAKLKKKKKKKRPFFIEATYSVDAQGNATGEAAKDRDDEEKDAVETLEEESDDDEAVKDEDSWLIEREEVSGGGGGGGGGE